jgi:hypothetical protein
MLMARSRIRSSSVGGRRAGGCPKSRLPASVAENHSPHLIAQALDFFRFSGVPKALGKFEEFPLFAPLSLDPVLDKFQEHSVSAKPTRFSQAANPCRESHR